MSGYVVSEASEGANEQLSGSLTKRKNSLTDTAQPKEKKPQPSLTSLKVDGKKNLPAIYKEKSVIAVGASHLFANDPSNTFSPENYQKALAELKLVLIGILGFLFLVVVGWDIVLRINYIEGSEVVYNSGLIGGCLMLIALIYSVIKRVKAIRRYLTSEIWYYLHIVCGAIGAYLVIFHTSFELRSINGTISFITTLVVVISGALGRYLFTLSTISLHRQFVDVMDTEKNLFDMTAKYEPDRSARLQERLSKFALHCFRKPRSKIRYFARWVSIICFGLYYYLASRRDLRKIAKQMSAVTNLEKKEISVLKKYQKRNLLRYILHIIKMGYTSLIEQVLRHWRILHIPSLYLLTVTVILHVIFIHMY